MLVFDNSYLHKKHQSYDSERFHLKLIIKSQELKKMDKLKSNRMIYSILEDEMKKKIHALQIEIS